jgi:hypothetical protein
VGTVEARGAKGLLTASEFEKPYGEDERER